MTRENIILVYEIESEGDECKDKFSKTKSSIYIFSLKLKHKFWKY